MVLDGMVSINKSDKLLNSLVSSQHKHSKVLIINVLWCLDHLLWPAINLNFASTILWCTQVSCLCASIGMGPLWFCCGWCGRGYLCLSVWVCVCVCVWSWVGGTGMWWWIMNGSVGGEGRGVVCVCNYLCVSELFEGIIRNEEWVVVVRTERGAMWVRVIMG